MLLLLTGDKGGLVPNLAHTKQEGTIQKLLGFMTKKNGINFDNVWCKLACEQTSPSSGRATSVHRLGVSNHSEC